MTHLNASENLLPCFILLLSRLISSCKEGGVCFKEALGYHRHHQSAVNCYSQVTVEPL